MINGMFTGLLSPVRSKLLEQQATTHPALHIRASGASSSAACRGIPLSRLTCHPPRSSNAPMLLPLDVAPLLAVEAQLEVLGHLLVHRLDVVRLRQQPHYIQNMRHVSIRTPIYPCGISLSRSTLGTALDLNPRFASRARLRVVVLSLHLPRECLGILGQCGDELQAVLLFDDLQGLLLAIVRQGLFRLPRGPPVLVWMPQHMHTCTGHAYPSQSLALPCVVAAALRHHAKSPSMSGHAWCRQASSWPSCRLCPWIVTPWLSLPACSAPARMIDMRS